MMTRQQQCQVEGDLLFLSIKGAPTLLLVAIPEVAQVSQSLGSSPGHDTCNPYCFVFWMGVMLLVPSQQHLVKLYKVLHQCK